MSTHGYVVIIIASIVLNRAQGEVLSDSEQKELLEWKAPDWLQENIQYYWSGYDKDGSPVFIFELGKWDIRSVLERGPESAALLDKLILQMTVRFKQAGNDAPGSPGAVVIADADNVSVKQLAHIGVIPFFIRAFAGFQEYTRTPGYKRVIAINANYVALQLYNVAKPALGSAVELFEVYGTNKAKWLPVLLKDIDRKEIPEWYGGSKDHLPIAVYG